MSMRAGALVGIVLAALVAAGCVGGPGAATPSPTPTDPPVPATLPPLPPSDPPSPVPSATIEVSTVYTPDDEEIAALIEAGADEAIPQLKALNKMDPQKLEDLFLPFGEWIEAQRAGVAAYTPSTCTADALEAYLVGLNQYDDIREKFLAWRDWGAQGHAFPPAAPGQAVLAFEEAVALLEATCPAP